MAAHRAEVPEGPVEVAAQATVLALGGASWPNLGSDGSWVAPLSEAQVAVTPLEPANCGFRVAWSDVFRTRFAGQPLKRLALRCGAMSARGEAMVTADGIEGGGIYELSAPLREAIARDGAATLELDLRPDEAAEALAQRLSAPRGKQSLSNVLRKALRLSPVEIALLQEVAIRDGRKLATMPADEIAGLVKAVPLRLSAPMPIARAISTAGGVSFAGLDETFMLRARPGVFAAGEMLDWEAPTGGYLLQASFATGVAAARGALAWLAAHPHAS